MGVPQHHWNNKAAFGELASTCMWPETWAKYARFAKLVLGTASRSSGLALALQVCPKLMLWPGECRTICVITAVVNRQTTPGHTRDSWQIYLAA